MKKHTRIYLDYFGYTTDEIIPSELSGLRASDIHHIDARGMGGDSTGDKDCIENLMALTREEHEMFGDKEQYMAWLKQLHLDFMSAKDVMI